MRSQDHGSGHVLNIRCRVPTGFARVWESPFNFLIPPSSPGALGAAVSQLDVKLLNRGTDGHLQCCWLAFKIFPHCLFFYPQTSQQAFTYLCCVMCVKYYCIVHENPLHREMHAVAITLPKKPKQNPNPWRDMFAAPYRHWCWQLHSPGSVVEKLI